MCFRRRASGWAAFSARRQLISPRSTWSCHWPGWAWCSFLGRNTDVISHIQGRWIARFPAPPRLPDVSLGPPIPLHRWQPVRALSLIRRRETLTGFILLATLIPIPTLLNTTLNPLLLPNIPPP